MPIIPNVTDNRIYIDAFIFSAPLFILLIYSFIEIFDEFKFTYFRNSINKINSKSNIIRELCYCKLKDTDINDQVNPSGKEHLNCFDKCPVLGDVALLSSHKYVEDRSNYPYLTLDDIKNIYKLAIKLKQGKDTLSKYILASNEELQELLEEYVGTIDTVKKLKNSLKEKNPKRLESFFIDLRRLIIIFMWGEWHPSSKLSSKKMSNFYKNYAYPSDISKRLAYKMSIIINRDIIYSNCLYEEGKFPDLDSKLTKKDKILLKVASKSASTPDKCVQLNRLVLDSNYSDELENITYINYMWSVVKKKLVLGAKQAQYFDMAAVQFLLLGLISFRNNSNIIYIFALIGLFFLLVNFKESEEPFGWFKNRHLRLFAVFFVWLLGYLYYVRELADWALK